MIWPDRLAVLFAFVWFFVAFVVKSPDAPFLQAMLYLWAPPVLIVWAFLRLVRFAISGRLR